MARALARGWRDPVICSDSGSGRARALADELGGEALSSNREVAERSDLVVLCHKPAQLELVAGEIAGAVKAVASVLGGISTQMLSAVYPSVPVFVTMPNTPVEVRRGVVCFAAGEGVDAGLEREVIGLFERVATIVRMPEHLMEAATTAMGCSPAYNAVVMEAQIDAAIRYGLKADLASKLVVEAMAGTAALLSARGYDTLSVRREVTSPGGWTARGLAALEQAGVRAAFEDAADAVLGAG
jgi:pyrroline-5-carboxylate reductase